MMCRLLGLAPSGYFAWLKKPVSDRSREDKRLIRASFKASQGVYGAPRVFLDRREAGETGSKHLKKRIDNTRQQATEDVADYIENFYNRTHRHQHLAGVSPEQCEAAAQLQNPGVHNILGTPKRCISGAYAHSGIPSDMVVRIKTTAANELLAAAGRSRASRCRGAARVANLPRHGHRQRSSRCAPAGQPRAGWRSRSSECWHKRPSPS